MNRIKPPPGKYHIQIDGNGSGDVDITDTGATYTDEFGNEDEWFWYDDGDGWRLLPVPPARTIFFFYDTGEVIQINLKNKQVHHGHFNPA